jgi:hypothetical protein
VNYCGGYRVYLLISITAELLIMVFYTLIASSTTNSEKRELNEMNRCISPKVLHLHAGKDILTLLKV